MTDKITDKKPTRWFDQDGVLAFYDYADYTPYGKEALSRYLTKESHMFRHLGTYPNMIRAFELLYAESRHTKDFYTKILTGVLAGFLQAEHTIDKYFWCSQTIKGFCQEDFFCVSVEKHSAVASDIWDLTKHDILIDDYNPNLYHWHDRGGTSVKCINQLNSENPDFPHINVYWKPERIVEELKNIMKNII